MKIAILTQPLRANYGGVLQNYALQQVLIKLGHTPITLEKDINQYISTTNLIIDLPKRIISKYILRRRQNIFSEQKHNQYYLNLRKYTKPFVDKYVNLNYIHEFTTSSIMQYDAVIVGSDQVWRPLYNTVSLDYMFLSFIPADHKINRIAYAASFGVSEWEYSDIQSSKYSKLIQQFDAVSTREIDGIDFCKKFLKRHDVVSVLDPTLLIEKDYYLSICKYIPKSSKKILVAYILDVTDEIRNQLELIAYKKSLELNIISAHKNCSLYVEEWLSMFRDAELIITDSFHGTVFSIIFNKDFYSICNNLRGNSRFTSLLSQFNLQDRLFNDIKSINLNSNQIDWEIIENTKSTLQNKSIKFLTDNLNSNA